MTQAHRRLSEPSPTPPPARHVPLEGRGVPAGFALRYLAGRVRGSESARRRNDDDAELAACPGVVGARPPASCSPPSVPILQPFLQLPRILHSSRLATGLCPLVSVSKHARTSLPGVLASFSVFGPEKSGNCCNSVSENSITSYFYK